MQVTQVCIGRFHHFNLARQLEKHGLLESIYTGYPNFKLQDEIGIPRHKIISHPWLQAPYIKRSLIGLDKFEWLNKQWAWLNSQNLDNFVSKQITKPTIVFALSNSGLICGRKAQTLGGKYICDRGSTHIQFQNAILKEEYAIWGLNFRGIDERIIQKEILEYNKSDYITVPSKFVKESFLQMGVDDSKIKKIPYGARLERFKKVAEPDSNKFTVLWVGGISIRKGFMYALKAFQQFNHPNKEFIIIGNLENELKSLLKNQNLKSVTFLGTVANTDLPFYYSTSHVFILPSIEEGLAMVQGEALACGCPIIATSNSGCEDLITNGEEGFIVPIRSVHDIKNSFVELADNNLLRIAMSQKALSKVNNIGGWDNYGLAMANLINELK